MLFLCRQKSASNRFARQFIENVSLIPLDLCMCACVRCKLEMKCISNWSRCQKCIFIFNSDSNENSIQTKHDDVQTMQIITPCRFISTDCNKTLKSNSAIWKLKSFLILPFIEYVFLVALTHKHSSHRTRWKEKLIRNRRYRWKVNSRLNENAISLLH